VVDSCECDNEPTISIKCGECSFFLPGRAKDLSAVQVCSLGSIGNVCSRLYCTI